MNTYIDRLRIRLSQLFPETLPNYPDQRSPVADHLISAQVSFLHGFKKALETPMQSLASLFYDLPAEKLGFALEGAAMAMVMLDELGKSAGEHLSHLLAKRSEEEKILCSIGVGWASARLRKPLHWLPSGLESNYQSSVANGYGFHEGFFYPYRFINNGLQIQSVDLSEFFDIGLGRALWFAKLGRLQLIAKVIDDLPKIRKMRFWQGVGVACAFSSNRVQEQDLIRLVKGFEAHLCNGLDTGTYLVNTLALLKKPGNTYEEKKIY